jgi:hypothetical protein
LLLNKLWPLLLLFPTLKRLLSLLGFSLLLNKLVALKTLGIVLEGVAFKNGFDFVTKLPVAFDGIVDFGSSFVLTLISSLLLFPNKEGVLLSLLLIEFGLLLLNKPKLKVSF